MEFLRNEIIVFIPDKEETLSVGKQAPKDLFAHPPEKPNRSYHRVLYVNVQDDMCVTIGIYGPVWPKVRSYLELQELATIGSVDKLGYEPFKFLYQPNGTNLDEEARRDKRMEFVKPFITPENFIKLFYRRSRGNMFEKYAKKPNTTDPNKLCRSALEHVVRQYLQRGLCKDAVRTDLSNCGAPGKVRITKENEPLITKQLGRPSDEYLTEGKRGVNVGPDLRRQFQIIVRRELFKKNPKHYASAWKIFDRTFFPGGSDDESKRPTQNQFNYWARKILTELGDPLKPTRIIRNIASHKADCPGQRYQIDAWLIEANVVDPNDRSKILGRPILFIVIDVYSYAIVGIHITIEDASWKAARIALYNAMTCKKDYFKQFNINMEPGDWDIYCTPEEIYADRGREMHNKKVETTIPILEVSVEAGPAFQPTYRGVVEGRFNMTGIKIGQNIPKSVNKAGRKTDRESRKDKRINSTITMDEIVYFFYRTCIHINHYHEVAHGNEREEQMIKDQIKPTPLDLWEWGAGNIRGGLRIDDPDVVKVALLDPKEISVGRFGFQLLGYKDGAGLRYTWDDENEEDLIARFYGKRLNAACSDIVDEIYLIVDQGKKDQQILTLRLHDQSQAFKGLTFQEYKWVRKLLNTLSAKLKRARELAGAHDAADWQDIMDEAKECAKQDRMGKTDKEILSKIRQNRTEAQAAARLQNNEGWKAANEESDGSSDKSNNPPKLNKPKAGGFFKHIPPGKMSDYE